MAIRPSEHPTKAELEILNVLWQQGPSTVRDVHQILQADRDTSLTTTLKMLQVMTEKGLTSRSDSRPQVFTATEPQEKTQAGLLREFVRKTFGGSVRKLMIRAVEDGELNSDELKEIQKLMNAFRKEKRGGK